MVLEEATQSEESASSFYESPPSGDPDTYSGDRNPTILKTRDPKYLQVAPNIYVNFDQLPQTWSSLRSLKSSPELCRAAQEYCRTASEVLERPLKEEEAYALTYHFARGISISSYGTPIGLTLAAFQAFRTRHKYRFPGHTPGKNFNPDKFLQLSGAHARVMWHVLRINAYIPVGWLLGQIFFASYGLSVGAAGKMNDPRLKELNQKIQANSKNHRGGSSLPGNREVDQTPGPREAETLNMARQRQRAQEMSRQSPSERGMRATREEVDDMSPTGGAFSDEFMDMGKESGGGLMSDEEIRISNTPRGKQESVKQGNMQAMQVPSASADASSAVRRGAAPAPAAGAWERLRQQAASGRQSQTSSHASVASERASSEGDSFSFSQVDEDRQLARSEAQKDFDARIAQEREGKNFNDQGNGKRGWSS